MLTRTAPRIWLGQVASGLKSYRRLPPSTQIDGRRQTFELLLGRR
jgi:hypothetical protein